MTSKNFPEKEIWGYYSDNTERVYQHMDNYLAVKYQESSQEKIGEVFAENNISAGFGIEFAPDADLYNRFKNGEIVSWEYYDLIVKAQLTYLRFEGHIYSERENEFTWRELHV
jgi:hypothetical protein